MKTATNVTNVTVVAKYLDNEHNNPYCVWVYNHNPENGIRPHARQYGYWIEREEDDKKFSFVENISKNLILMDYEQFLDWAIGVDKGLMQTFSSVEEFENNWFLNKL